LKLELNYHQSGVVPFRKKGKKKIEVLLITSVKKRRWIIPKGYVEFNLSAFESAKKEAIEEAGVLGSNETFELGEFIIQKSYGKCFMKIFSMEVIKEYDDYPEKAKRKRKWFELDEAAEKVAIPEISNMVLSLKKKLE
jgi:8-oxo-dGTP pyrophosphatase MutT (NUDIX family)